MLGGYYGAAPRLPHRQPARRQDRRHFTAGLRGVALLSFHAASQPAHLNLPCSPRIGNGGAFGAVINQSGPWWIGWIEEVPGVNCQERTRDDLLQTLKVTLKEALDLNRREALEAAGEVFEETPIAV
jgi:hypothetical protein